MSTFQELGLNKDLLNAITDMGFVTPSDVQLQAIPQLLTEERDLVALAQTGTGKTAAFGFPMLQKIDVDSRTTQGLILSPTRELCLQITNELKQYGKYCNMPTDRQNELGTPSAARRARKHGLRETRLPARVLR